jgi:hypothetical protein
MLAAGNQSAPQMENSADNTRGLAEEPNTAAPVDGPVAGLPSIPMHLLFPPDHPIHVAGQT